MSSTTLSYGSAGYEQQLSLIREKLVAAHSVFSIAHPYSDGDALGSQLALHHYCLATGKKSVCLNFDPIPEQISWLSGSEQLVDALPHGEVFDLAFLMEVTEASRLGDRTKFFRHATTCVHLDHHVGIPGLGHLNLLDPVASSTCEILYNLLEPMWQPMSRAAMNALYVGIMTDTGNFRYASTTPRSHEIAAKMIASGLLDIPSIFQRVYESTSLPSVVIHGTVMTRVKSCADGRIVYSWLTNDDFVQHNAQETDADGCIRHLCAINGVEAAIMFKEQTDGTVKISFRSRSALDVRAISLIYGGGGHRQAAGATMTGSLAAVKKEILSVVQQSLPERDT